MFGSRRGDGCSPAIRSFLTIEFVLQEICYVDSVEMMQHQKRFKYCWSFSRDSRSLSHYTSADSDYVVTVIPQYGKERSIASDFGHSTSADQAYIRLATAPIRKGIFFQVGRPGVLLFIGICTHTETFHTHLPLIK